MCVNFTHLSSYRSVPMARGGRRVHLQLGSWSHLRLSQVKTSLVSFIIKYSGLGLDLVLYVILFLELQYDIPMIPVGIDIYETYHPGAVVRILACNANPVCSDDKKTKPGEVE